MSISEADLKRRARGWILQFLAQEPVGSDGRRAQVKPERIQELLFEVQYDLALTMVREQLAYLKERGYVEIEKFTGRAAQIVGGMAMGVRIVAAGTDVVEGTRTDPGISLGALG